MLEEIPEETVRKRVFRLASPSESVEAFLRSQGLDAMSIDDMMRLLRPHGVANSLREMCDAPFRPRRRLGRRTTRFSDGSFPVFYASLETRTAEAEFMHWAPKFLGSPGKPRTAHYVRFACDFHGRAKDLTSRRRDWPPLTHDSDYSFCNGLGAEAVASGLGGLLAPSARREDGTNLPVFSRAALDNPGDAEDFTAVFDSATGKVSLEPG